MVIASLLVSCMESSELPNPEVQSFLERRAILTKAANERLSSGITQEDIENYLALQMDISCTDIKDILRYDIDDDVYVFIVNLKDGGWLLCSGDYSSVPVIATSESGYLDLSGKLSKHTQGWLQTIRNQIISNRESTSETVCSNRNNWIKVKRALLSREEDLDTQDVEIVIIMDTLHYEFYPALTETSWDQGYPYNQALPKRYDSVFRCVAGCTVVAIAQLLYYTHYAFGLPNDIYEESSCDDYYNEGPPYSFAFSSPSATTWDLMSPTYNGITNSDPYIPALYALIASRSNTTYTPDYGETLETYIPSTLASFLLTGVTSQGFYSPDIRDEVADDRPVLCGGISPSTYEAHSFLIDGYRWEILRETELIYDTEGHLLSQNVFNYNILIWHINTGEHPTHSMWSNNDYYYTLNRKMFIGWSLD